MSTIEVSDLCVFAQERRLLGPVSFALAQGETLVVMGETGAGKSLIAQAILGTLPASLHMTGAIAIGGKQVEMLRMAERAAMWGREIVTLPQEPWLALDPLMKAWRQVAETHVHVGGLSPEAARDATSRDLVAIGLEPLEPRLPSQLSGGMAQRVAFAAATAGKAPILLADEPTKGLDSDRRDRVVSLLHEVPRQGGTLLAITHEAFVARSLGGRIIVLREGDLVEEGKTADVLSAPKAPYTRALLAADPANWPKSTASATATPLLTAENLAIGRGAKSLVKNFSLTLHEGEKLALVGPSGVGKSTLLDALAGLIAPFSGTLTRAAGLGPHAIQKLYQDPPSAFPKYISLGQSLRDVAEKHGGTWDQILGTMDALKLREDLLRRTPDAVSGGELQRIAIARALAARPKILLADEPTSRLDPITQQETMALLAQIAERETLAVVLVTHDRDMAHTWADKTIEVNLQSS